jgi:alkanesulfonate monooxygenase SsuD/methylene tetrahydromethanopterin reductase-like flavin-dependent oxidoreductase (luciferase family)
MKVGIGLPTGVPGLGRGDFLRWAGRAEARGFSSVGAIDRLVYGNWEPVIALAAAAATTERIGLLSAVLAVPSRGAPALLAKQAATLQELSEGRLRLGVGLGARRDDYRAAAARPTRRGGAIDAALEEMTGIWSGGVRGLAGPIGPLPTPPPGLLIAGFAPASFRRAARFGEGWIGAGPPSAIAAGAEQVRAAWLAAGREDAPRIVAIAYFGLGATAAEDAATYLGDYYAFAGKREHLLPGDAMADLQPEDMVASALVDEGILRGACAAFAASGCDELVLFPVSVDPEQVDRLADVVLPG